MPKLAWYWYVFIGIILIGLIGNSYKFLNTKHIEKYGYPIFDSYFIGILAGGGGFLFIGYCWREHAIDHSKALLEPNLFIGFISLGIIFWIIGQSFSYYQNKRHLGWLNILIGICACCFVAYFFGAILLFLIVWAIGKRGAEQGGYSSGDPNADLEEYYEQERWKQIPSPHFKGDNDDY